MDTALSSQAAIKDLSKGTLTTVVFCFTDLSPESAAAEHQQISECKRILSDHIHSDHNNNKDHVDEHVSIKDFRLWAAAISSIVVISLCGIFGVLVIPIMQKVFYQHLIQFLVALAIGSMLGDALLHLIPHALSPPSPGTSSTNPSFSKDHSLIMLLAHSDS